MYVCEVYNRSPVRFQEVCQMYKVAFNGLLRHLEGQLEDTKHVTIMEQVMILFVVGNAGSNALASERFQHSGETISQYYNKVVLALENLESWLIIQPNPGAPIPQSISSTPILYPWFKGCVGAIDRTHIQAIVEADQAPYCNHKGTFSQNVLASCNFDGSFTFILAGFEGRAQDSCVLQVVRQVPSRPNC